MITKPVKSVKPASTKRSKRAGIGVSSKPKTAVKAKSGLAAVLNYFEGYRPDARAKLMSASKPAK